ncbi:hypothetical protein EDD85DRAFT_448798 [Armillaria nabsnona]|nr:hypothetical protein EDD85DRAFT_448798 [Armillaria nabsnona]
MPSISLTTLSKNQQVPLRLTQGHCRRATIMRSRNRKWGAILCSDKAAFIDGGPCADCMRRMLDFFGLRFFFFFGIMKMLPVLICILTKDCMMNCALREPSCAVRWSTSFQSHILASTLESTPYSSIPAEISVRQSPPLALISILSSMPQPPRLALCTR